MSLTSVREQILELMDERDRPMTYSAIRAFMRRRGVIEGTSSSEIGDLVDEGYVASFEIDEILYPDGAKARNDGDPDDSEHRIRPGVSSAYSLTEKGKGAIDA